LAGFAVGEVEKSSLLTGESILPGGKLIGVASSGIHSNGFSLARKVLPENKSIWEALMVPTHIYVQAALEAMDKFGPSIVGLAHITGGGWRNLFRLNKNVGYQINSPLPVPSILQQIARDVQPQEMYNTFNMGMGLGLICKDNEKGIIDCFTKSGYLAQVVGTVTAEAEVLRIKDMDVVLKG
jgi:phosphoribosylformylglycinamidine cyclo-ligase